jgi:AraC-like DNA-binding protein
LFTSNNRLVDTLCNKIIQLVNDDTLTKTSYSKLLSKTLNYNYTYLSNLFSSIKGTTIQQFIIYHKIERVKKLIVKGERNLTDISFELNYSSVAHLSNQFKKVTGLSPTQFKIARQTQPASDS